MPTVTELSVLLAATARGDEAAFRMLYDATRAKLFGVVLRILRRRDAAEDVIQDVYVRIWSSAAQFDPARASPITWMVTIARNRAIDVLRRRQEPVADDGGVEDIPAAAADPLAERERSEELNRLLDCIGRLPPERRDLIRLAYIEGLSREQLAARVDAPVNTVKTWLRRSLVDVRECLGL